METTAELPLASGAVSLGELADPLVVDPDPWLLETVVLALEDVDPSLADPGLDELRSAAAADVPPWSAVDAHPTVSVLVREEVFERLIDGFHEASRVAAFVDAALLAPLRLDTPQPNAVVAGRDEGFAVVETPNGRLAVGSDASLRRRYAETRAEADSVRIPAPSRHRLYAAFFDRCGREMADDVVRALDASPDPHADVVGPRIRAYLVGARHERFDHTVRRACEDAGIGSSATFTGVKRRLVDADVVTTDRVGQPVGRPRKRLRVCSSVEATSMSALLARTRELLDD